VEEVAGLGIGISLLFVGVLLFSLHRSINAWLLPMLTRLAHPQGNFLTRAALWPLAKAAEGVASVVNYVDHRISVSAAHTMAPVAAWFSGIAAWLTTIAYTAGNFAHDVEYGVVRLTTVVLPREIGQATRPIRRRLTRAEKRLVAVGGSIIALRHWINGQLHHHVYPELKHLLHQTTVALPRAIGRVGHRVGELEHELTHPTTKWLRRIAARMWLVALFGLLVRTLARKFPWLFCRKVKSVGNRLCGLDQDLLNALLLDTVIIGGSISVAEFAKDLQAIEGAAVNLMSGFIREL
jgi:hypothetical protein